LDSPLSQLKRLDAGTAARLQRAGRRSLEQTVNLALEHQVVALVVAGDLFDGPVKDAGAGLWAESQFKRLTRAGIRVVLIRGNHDALSNAHRVLRWSEGIHELNAEQPETIELDQAGLAIHGQSFGARVEAKDLAASYPHAKRGFFNIGVLHTSLSGSSAHDTYAPTSVSVLEGKGYDYWALGHVHARTLQSLSDQCYIGYSGNTQGRHIREPGPKGCQLVTVGDGTLESVRFLETDSLQWYELRLNLRELELLGEIEDQVRVRAGQLLESVGDRSLALRISLEGSTSLHAELTRSGNIARLTDTLASCLADMGSVWLESLKIDSRPANFTPATDYSLPLAYLRQTAEQIRVDVEMKKETELVLEELLRKTRNELMEYGWPLTDPAYQPEEFDRLLGRAEDLLVARLMAGSKG
jgi:DNA repair exonuclease SbcCD nuclease subunit